MLIYRKLSILLISAAALAVAPEPVSAFDPAKVFEEKKPSSNKIFRFFFSARKNGNQEDAIGALKYAAEQGNQAAKWKLGRMYQIGDGVPKDPAAAYTFFTQIIENYGDALPGTPEWQFTSNAMVALGHYHLEGVPDADIPRDTSRAQVMFTTAATYFRNPEAQYELARMFLEGENSEVDIIQAARMLKTAATSGHSGAEALLGHMLFEGQYLRREPVRGLSMMLNAKQHASGNDLEWITRMQEEAFAAATEEERRQAIERMQKQSVSN
jgi:uncharacterized protein